LAENTIQAKRYSQAVFELALENKEIDRWLSDLQRMAALASIRELSEVMGNPMFSIGNKYKLLQKQLQGVSPQALNLVSILAQKGNFTLIKTIYSDFLTMVDRSKGITKADVITAVSIEESQKVKLAERLSNLTGKKAIVSLNVDPSIIGGMIARVDGKIIDGSTRSQLAVLKNDIVNSGR
jgi:F-type H+-transporting ATPase subunit delta